MRPRYLLLLLPLLLVALPPSRFAIAASPAPTTSNAYEQRLGAQLPRENIYRDDTGGMVRLDELLGGTPLALALGYFHCPNLCSVVRDDLLKALSTSGLVAGSDYSLIVLSIDPTEGSGEAALAKADDLARFPGPGAAENWHFLTGSTESVQALADAVGFHYRADPQRQRFAHPVGVVFATRGGVVSSYLLGVGYQSDDVRLALLHARGSRTGPTASPLLLLCYDYDPATGRYTLAIMNVLRLVSAITVAMIAGVIFLALRQKGRPV